MSDDPLLGGIALLQMLEQELLYFAAFWFVLGALDEFAVDCLWIGQRLWRWWQPPVDESAHATQAAGPLAIFVPAWKEARVIGPMVSYALRVWPQRDIRLYVGCYGNDPATVAAAMAAAAGDARLRIVIHDRPGPTTKADCLNRVYRAMCADERASGRRFAGVVMHDAEQVVSVVSSGTPQGSAVLGKTSNW
ncbi:glycosyltransferase [uncultured Novosphingobium sp.]|uniref:glycosyltransferase n=1 Tax=uncultured Novosphingobium sp. TaxID=292277 RepID=UPI00258E7330|nr:glycosyltransferase [uncultured Novosphingobium sp.]